MAADQWVLFIAAGVLLNLTPGPDVLFIVAHAVRRGVRAGVVAALGIAAGLAQYPAAELENHAGVFGQRNEIGRRHGTALRMLPAHQGFHTDHAPLGIDLGLIVQRQLVLRQRQTQIGLQAGAR